MEPAQVLAVSKSCDAKQANYLASDAKASYTLLSPDAAPEDYNPASVEWVSGDKLDYNLVAPESFERKPGGAWRPADVLPPDQVGGSGH